MSVFGSSVVFWSFKIAGGVPDNGELHDMVIMHLDPNHDGKVKAGEIVKWLAHSNEQVDSHEEKVESLFQADSHEEKVESLFQVDSHEEKVESLFQVESHEEKVESLFQ